MNFQLEVFWWEEWTCGSIPREDNAEEWLMSRTVGTLWFLNVGSSFECCENSGSEKLVKTVEGVLLMNCFRNKYCIEN